MDAPYFFFFLLAAYYISKISSFTYSCLSLYVYTSRLAVFLPLLNFVPLSRSSEFFSLHFQVVSCMCTPGWIGDDCSIDLDSCEENPCYPEVDCIDLPPPEVNATCGDCPTGLMGDGFRCFGEYKTHSDESTH